VDINYCFNQILPVFDSLNKELPSDFQLVDTFSNCFSFNIVKCKDAKAITAYFNKLKNIYQSFSNSPKTIFIISNTSVKNNIATFVFYIWRKHNIIRKAVHHAINVLYADAKLSTIRYDISQAIQLQDAIQIVIITNTILVAKRIFDSSYHSYQLYSITISNNLRNFLNKSSNNSITFWNCPSVDK